ncbi:hypothetical protein NU688_26645 [Variovorax sp. ZS18.2.2]|uniref:hypothetical protein n=1 Tax=Variovorax sp. ZS18.2.2 TaxID=2971255 RepID=UPI002151D7FB|nr:hypothetical protein [Variovorax sp. ZS18.2.2]MCR6479763.1 hypothetical protein [Variovorax sp. ZS18.2.2]
MNAYEGAPTNDRALHGIRMNGTREPASAMANTLQSKSLQQRPYATHTADKATVELRHLPQLLKPQRAVSNW